MVTLIIAVICLVMGFMTANRQVMNGNCENVLEYLMIVSFLWIFILLMEIKFKED